MYKWMVEKAFSGADKSQLSFESSWVSYNLLEVKGKFHFILKAFFLNKETHYMSIVCLKRFEVTGARLNIQTYN